MFELLESGTKVLVRFFESRFVFLELLEKIFLGLILVCELREIDGHLIQSGYQLFDLLLSGVEKICLGMQLVLQLLNPLNLRNIAFEDLG